MSDDILDFTVPENTNLTLQTELDDKTHAQSDAEDDANSDGNTKKRKYRSSVWQHFEPLRGKVKKAKCKYCGDPIVTKNGTSAMWNHLDRCSNYDNGEGSKSKKKRKTIPKGQLVSSPSYSKFDQEACRAQLVRTFVCAELPFRFVENEEFRKLLLILQPRFDIPSRYTLRRDIWALYIEELEKLKKFLKTCGRVCFTTDTWTSNQNLSYMSLTVHFVDSEFNLHKKIINFCQITGHTGDMMGQYVDTYLRNWELNNKILTVTVDNAKSNDVMIRYIKNMMRSWDNHVLNGDFVHMRCCTHVLNLIVKSGLKEDKGSTILKIRHAVKWVKSSPSRLDKFMKCASDEKISYKGVVVLDVDTRWNSTFLMLKVALKYRKAFELLDIRDHTFHREMLLKTCGITSGIMVKQDWDYIESVLPLLQLFFKSTNRLSGSLYVTSAMYMAEVFTIGKGINKHLGSTNKHIKETAKKMKGKFDKYWGDPDTINILLLVAFVLDPRVKMHFAEFYIDYLYGITKKAKDLKSRLMSSIRKLYVQYGGVDDSQSSQLATPLIEKDDDDIWCHYSQETGNVSKSKTEIEDYLNEDRVRYTQGVAFDILGWWKANLTRFPILARIAREILSIPASTVASKSAFSTGGRVVSDYRTCLTPKMVEALVCTQDWLKGKSLYLFSEEDLDEIHRLEKEITSQESVNLGDENHQLES